MWIGEGSGSAHFSITLSSPLPSPEDKSIPPLFALVRETSSDACWRWLFFQRSCDHCLDDVALEEEQEQQHGQCG